MRDKTHSLQASLGNPKAEALEHAALQLLPTLVNTFTGANVSANVLGEHIKCQGAEAWMEPGPQPARAWQQRAPLELESVSQHTFVNISLPREHREVCEEKTQPVSKDVPTAPQRHVPRKEEQRSEAQGPHARTRSIVLTSRAPTMVSLGFISHPLVWQVQHTRAHPILLGAIVCGGRRNTVAPSLFSDDRLPPPLKPGREVFSHPHITNSCCGCFCQVGGITGWCL